MRQRRRHRKTSILEPARALRVSADARARAVPRKALCSDAINGLCGDAIKAATRMMPVVQRAGQQAVSFTASFPS